MMRPIRRIKTNRAGWAMFVSEETALQVARWCRGAVTEEYPDDRAPERVLTITYGPRGAEKHVRVNEWLVHMSGEFFAVPNEELVNRYEFTARS